MLKTYGLTKVLHIDGESVALKASAGLLPLYKSYFGRDLIDALMEYTRVNQAVLARVSALGGLQGKPAEELSEAEVEALEAAVSGVDTEFIANLFCALILNAVPPEERPPMPDALDVVPPALILDEGAMNEAISLISSFVNVKKN